MPSSTNELFRPSDYEMRIQPINTGLAVGQIRKRTAQFQERRTDCRRRVLPLLSGARKSKLITRPLARPWR